MHFIAHKPQALVFYAIVSISLALCIKHEVTLKSILYEKQNSHP